MKPHYSAISCPDLGWRLKPGSFAFDFIEPGVLAGVRLSNDGLNSIEIETLNPTKPTVLVLGDQFIADYTLPNGRICNNVADHFNVQVINCSVIHYTLAQLALLLQKIIRRVRPVAVLLMFTSNMPRRLITIHEAGMPKNFQFPFFLNTRSGLAECEQVETKSKNELVYVADSGAIVRKSIDYSKLFKIFSEYENYSPIKDVLIPSIKEVENDQFSRVRKSLRWRLTKFWLAEILGLCKKNGAEFFCFSLPIYYFLVEHWSGGKRSHPYGSKLGLENQFKLLNQFSNDLDFEFFDIYSHIFHSQNAKNYHQLYIDPSYAYFSDFGCEFIGEFVNEKIRSVSTKLV